MSSKWKSNSYSEGASYSSIHPFQTYQQPKLVRASTLNIPTHQMLMNVQVTIDFLGDINSMTSNWTESELSNSRRLVLITSTQDYSHLNLQFKPIAQEDYKVGSAVLSCIFWEKTGRFYLTSVELISLLEQLVKSKFPVEEKNRIRRNLQSIKPLTISKSNDKYHELFELIMNFSNPKPRRIEKDVKVIYWDHLKEALAKVLSKYIVDPTSPHDLPVPQSLLPPPHIPQQLTDSSQPRYFQNQHQHQQHQQQQQLQQQHQHQHQQQQFFYQQQQPFPPFLQQQPPSMLPPQMYFLNEQQYNGQGASALNYPGVSASSSSSFITTTSTIPTSTTNSSSYIDVHSGNNMLTSNPYHSEPISNDPSASQSNSQSQNSLGYPLNTESYNYHPESRETNSTTTTSNNTASASNPTNNNEDTSNNNTPSATNPSITITSDTTRSVKREESPSATGYYQSQQQQHLQQHQSGNGGQYDYNFSSSGTSGAPHTIINPILATPSNISGTGSEIVPSHHLTPNVMISPSFNGSNSIGRNGIMNNGVQVATSPSGASLINGVPGGNSSTWGVVLQYDQFGNPIFKEYE